MNESFTFNEDILSMSKKGDKYICSHCLKTLKSYGEPAHLVTSLICELFMDDEFVIMDIKCKLAPILRFLENKGFLLSTEINKKEIRVFPNYTLAFFDDMSEKFCWCHYVLENNE